MSRSAVFLDRDGTLIEDVGFLADPAGVRLLPTVIEALQTLSRHDLATIVISNQSGIARGYFGHAEVEAVNAELARLLADAGVVLDGWYWCPHYDGGCACRKPEPGLVHAAVRDHDLILAGSAMIGDRGSDVELGQRLGMPGVLVPGPAPYAGPEPDFRAQHLLDAVTWVIAHGR